MRSDSVSRQEAMTVEVVLKCFRGLRRSKSQSLLPGSLRGSIEGAQKGMVAMQYASKSYRSPGIPENVRVRAG